MGAINETNGLGDMDVMYEVKEMRKVPEYMGNRAMKLNDWKSASNRMDGLGEATETEGDAKHARGEEIA